MPTKDAYNRTGGEAVSLHPAAITATNVVTPGADLQLYDSALVYCQVGAMTGSEAIHLEIQDGSVGGTLDASYTAVVAGELLGGTIGTLTGTTDASQLVVRGYIGDARYLRVAVTSLTGTVECNAFIVPGDPRSGSTR